MSGKRRQLQVALCRYTTDTLNYINTVREFCEKFSKWKITREEDITIMMHIKDRADKINLNFSHFTQSEEKGKAFLEYMKSKVTQMTADSRRAELEKELSEVLNGTLEGLKKLNCFLDAVAKLALTSLHVFKKNQVLHLPTGISFEHVQAVITAAQQICPLLLEFKRDSKEFFLPKFDNVDVLAYQLDRYIVTSQIICEKLKESAIDDVWLKTTRPVVNLNVDLSEANIQTMLFHIYLLDEIRTDPNFRMVFLFKEKSSQDFMGKFEERQPRMLKFLNELEQCAVQLDKMSKGAKISSVAGSSVGAVGGVLSIVGLALIPVTAGVSLALTMTGVVLGVASGLNSAVTTFTEIGVNETQKNKANEVFQNFMEDMQSIQKCLVEVIRQPTAEIEKDFNEDMFRGFYQVRSVGNSIHSLVQEASDVKLIKSNNLIVGSGKMVAKESQALSNAPAMASEIPEMSQVAFKGSLGLSKSARAGAIVSNALFIGLDIFFICKDSISLAKGSETELSQLIRARAALWRSEMDSWQKICDSLNEGLKTSEKKKSALERPFYPVTMTNRLSVSFVKNKTQQDREMRHIRGLYVFVVVLGDL